MLKESAKLIPDVPLRAKFASVIRAIETRLQGDTLGFGEIHRSRGNVVTHLAALGPIMLEFSVDKEKKLVVVTKCGVVTGRDGDDSK